MEEIRIPSLYERVTVSNKLIEVIVAINELIRKVKSLEEKGR